MGTIHHITISAEARQRLENLNRIATLSKSGPLQTTTSKRAINGLLTTLSWVFKGFGAASVLACAAPTEQPETHVPSDQPTKSFRPSMGRKSHDLTVQYRC